MRTFLIVSLVLLVISATAALVALTHTQIIVGAIQKFSAGTVNTINSYDPLGEPLEAVKDNGQYTVTEIKYSDNHPNSFLDITYPDKNRDKSRPTLIYFHGGGFFGGSKNVGDPLAGSDATALLDDMCAEGFNLVNIDYVLVPEYHFPAPLAQANEAFQFLIDHADEYHLDMGRVVIMGSSAGAIMASQLGSIITNPTYAETLNIAPTLTPEQVKAVVLDDAPLDYDKFSLGTKILVGNYVKGSIFLNREEVRKYNNIPWVDSHYPPAFLLGSEYHADMRAMDQALNNANVEHALVDPLAERGLEMPHGFVASERVNEVAKDAFDRMMLFIKQQAQ
ncbi:alpha/beta hydrolase [Bifidobacterium tsurumiense]|uniref:alpha/beta hydrolase n=1 Tax=Bifidobacterium tsurumiense TaxID=356829 RepID=UPI0012B21356|nr:alpha/beta hydrolase [Bifidobacterium tsurumiense]MSS12423.1 alpha/beta hydrolase [Bifidobacterium tsurumiense]